MKEYQEYLKDNFSPKLPKSSSAGQEETPYDPNKYVRVKRYRYYKGVSFGEISSTEPIAKDVEEIKKMGNQNM